ncbi:MAG: aminoacyl-tRNA hydrolase [Candidatus Parcubacteria bacterium]|nr:aminoacyl-tRNA hydrolase [Burkholderiales bacterium]
MAGDVRPASIRLVVGLGNPGKDYERTRHNAGFWAVERFAAQSGVALRKDGKYQALVGRMEQKGGASGAWLVMPQGFMNASGHAVQMLAGFFKIPPAEILVIHDELDFAPGVAKMKQGGGIAGHNGLRDISQRLGSHDYWRLRLGIGHPGDRSAVSEYVLGRPGAEDKEALDAAVGRSIEILPLCLAGDMQGAMQKLHSFEKEKPVQKKAVPKLEAKPEPKPEPKREPKPASKDPPKDPPKDEPNVAVAPEKPAAKGLFGLFKKPKK